MGAARHARRRAWEHVQGVVRGVVPAGALAHVLWRAVAIVLVHALVGVIRDVTQRAKVHAN